MGRLISARARGGRKSCRGDPCGRPTHTPARDKRVVAQNDKNNKYTGGYKTRPYRSTNYKSNHYINMSNDLPDRQSIRLKNYDYAKSGLYFVTICTENREYLLGDIVDGKMVLNECGNMIEKWWNGIPEHFDMVELDTFQIMPNHIHMIIHIVGAGLVPARGDRATTRVAPTAVTLGDIIGAFKSLTTHEYILNVKNNCWKPFDKRLWQRNYYERIIRNEEEYVKIKEYIKLNPMMWERDRNNLNNIRFIPQRETHERGRINRRTL